MRILAAFDGSPMSESALAQVAKLASPSDEVVLLSVVEHAAGVHAGQQQAPTAYPAAFPISTPPVPQPGAATSIEVKSQAIEREAANRRDYLLDLAGRLPSELDIRCEVLVGDDPACEIIKHALSVRPDLIIMTTHGHTGLVHILFGDVAEEIVRSGVAPVLLVHPQSVRDARKHLT